MIEFSKVGPEVQGFRPYKNPQDGQGAFYYGWRETQIMKDRTS